MPAVEGGCAWPGWFCTGAAHPSTYGGRSCKARARGWPPERNGRGFGAASGRSIVEDPRRRVACLPDLSGSPRSGARASRKASGTLRRHLHNSGQSASPRPARCPRRHGVMQLYSKHFRRAASSGAVTGTPHEKRVVAPCAYPRFFLTAQCLQDRRNVYTMPRALEKVNPPAMTLCVGSQRGPATQSACQHAMAARGIVWLALNAPRARMATESRGFGESR